MQQFEMHWILSLVLFFALKGFKAEFGHPKGGQQQDIL